MNAIIDTEYRVSERVVLRPGDRFRVTAGPYWRSQDGSRIPMAERGVLTFARAIRRGAVVRVGGGELTAAAPVTGHAGSMPAGGMDDDRGVCRGNAR